LVLLQAKNISAGKAAAETIASTLAIRQKLANLGKNATADSLRAALTDRSFSRTLVVNDYPQHARWKATHKPSIAHVLEFSDVAVTTKGVYFAPGRKPGPGEEKLALLIDGRTQMDVDRAEADLRQMLEEAAADARPDQDAYVKYSVL
jgi:ATP-dependent RNA helicase DDX46/PRP5